MKRYALSCVALLLLAGCGNDGHQDIKQWMEESSRDLKGRVPPLPELKPFPVVSYDAAGNADPFDARRIEPERKAGGGNRPDFDRPKEQLENYPLESISFVGLVKKTKNNIPFAIVTVDGVVYQVTKGNYLGQNFGRIVDITSSEIILKEIVQDPTGQTSDWVERTATLQLQEGAEGKGKESKK